MNLEERRQRSNDEERIRELEAELAYRRSYDTGDFTGVRDVIQKLTLRAETAEKGEAWWRETTESESKKRVAAEARVEKAEEERDDWKECAESMQQERDSVKARVAELEREAAPMREYLSQVAPRFIPMEEAIAFQKRWEAREREAE